MFKVSAMTLQSDKAVCVGGWNGFHVALVMKSYKLFLSLSSKKEGTPSSIRREVRWLNNTELRSFYSVKDTLTTIWHVTKHQIICELWTLSKAKNKSYCMHQSPISSEKKGVFFIKDFHQAKLCGTQCRVRPYVGGALPVLGSKIHFACGVALKANR